MDQVFVRSDNFSLKNSPVLEIVESADGIDESIDHNFVIAASERGVDSVARVKFAQWFLARVQAEQDGLDGVASKEISEEARET